VLDLGDRQLQEACARDTERLRRASRQEAVRPLARKGIENDAARDGAYRFLTTGDPKTFRATGTRFLQLPIDEVERVTIAELEAAA